MKNKKESWDQPGTALRADAVVATFTRGTKYTTAQVNKVMTAAHEHNLSASTLRSRRDRVRRYLREKMGIDLVCRRAGGERFWLIGPTALQAATFNADDRVRSYSENKAKFFALQATHPTAVSNQARLRNEANERLKDLLAIGDRRGRTVVEVMIDVGLMPAPTPAPAPAAAPVPAPAVVTPPPTP